MLSQKPDAIHRREWDRAKGPAAVESRERHKAKNRERRKIPEYRLLQNIRNRIHDRQNTIANLEELLEQKREKIIELHRELVKLERAWQQRKKQKGGTLC